MKPKDSPSHQVALTLVALLALPFAACEYSELLTSSSGSYGTPYGGYEPGGYSAPVGPEYAYGGYGFSQPGPSYGAYTVPVYSRIHVLSARWESERRTADVTMTVQNLLDNGIFSFKAENRTFGLDPDRGKHKRLYLTYRTRGVTRTIVANEGDTVRLN